MNTMNKLFIDLGYSQATLYYTVTPIVFIECLVKLRSLRDLHYECYKALVNEKILIPVELMPTEMKTALWEEAKGYAKGRLDQKSGIRFLKAMVALNHFI